MCQSMVNIQSPTAEIRRGKKEDRRKKERNYRMKILWSALLHRATINIMSASATQSGHNLLKQGILAATPRWFTAGGAIRIAQRQLSQTWKLRHYDVIDDVITRKVQEIQKNGDHLAP